MEKKRLFVDMDGTLARFHDQVNYLERMFEKDFFRDLEPFENMVEGVRHFIRNNPDVEVYILSAKVLGEPPYCEMEKHAWMDKHLPEIPAERRIFTEMGRPKAEYIPGGVTKNDYILDDYNKGLNQWMYDGGSAIKCHNNINQKGLGAHGGRAGNLWVGPMVHTDDKPEMIAAEIAGHMGLEYDLNKVLAGYPDISFDVEKTGHKQIVPVGHGSYCAFDPDVRSWGSGGPIMDNPLNAIRYLDGAADFREVHITGCGDPISIPVFQLQDICMNAYGINDYKVIMLDNKNEFASVVKGAIMQAELPIVGQIDYLHVDGTVGYSVSFRDVEEMQKEIRDSNDCGRPITAVWNVIIPPKPLRELGYFEVAERLYLVHNLSEDKADYLAKALIKPAQERTEAEMLDLTDFWHVANPPIPESLTDFLGVDSEWIRDPDFKTSGQEQVPAPELKPGLDALIHRAQNAQNGANPGQGQNGKSPFGR